MAGLMFPQALKVNLLQNYQDISVDKIFFSLIYQFWNVYFIMYLHSLC